MPEAAPFPLWYLLAIAVIGSLPATLTALAGLVVAWNARKEIGAARDENKISNDKIEAKVDNVQKEVDGKHSLLINAIKDIATAATDAAANAVPRQGRKTDP